MNSSSWLEFSGSPIPHESVASLVFNNVGIEKVPRTGLAIRYGAVPVTEPPEVKSTERARFEAVAMPCLDALHGTALRLTRRREDAADLVQETFLRGYRTFSNFVPGT